MKARRRSTLFAISAFAMCEISAAFHHDPVRIRKGRSFQQYAPSPVGLMEEESVICSFPSTSTPSTEERRDTSSQQLPPLLQDMVTERREFEMNLGKAMDVLRGDYPLMLKRRPDFSIFHPEIKVKDPSGVQLTGLTNYQTSFKFLQTIVGLFYNTDRSMVQYRMVYDFARSSIRISFNVMLVPKVVGNRRNSLYIDGISVYKMDAKSGKIVEHHVENLLVNNRAIRPPYRFSELLLQPVMLPQRIPVGIGAGVGAMIASVAPDTKRVLTV